MDKIRLIETLRTDEGCVKQGDRHSMYKDTVGKYTTGYGRNLTDRGISESEARMMLINDVLDVTKECRQTFSWFESLDDVRQEVVLNMVFNIGMPKFKGFKRMIHHVERREFASAAIEMLDSKWANQVGRRAIRLAAEMRDGF